MRIRRGPTNVRNLITRIRDQPPLVQQYANQELYSGIIKSRRVCGTSPTGTKAESISKEEENVVRYAARYVAFALLKKHEPTSSDTSLNVSAAWL